MNNKLTLRLGPSTLHNLICTHFKTSNYSCTDCLGRLISIVDKEAATSYMASVKCNHNSSKGLDRYHSYMKNCVSLSNNSTYIKFCNLEVCESFTSNQLHKDPYTVFHNVSQYLNLIASGQHNQFIKCLLYIISCDPVLMNPAKSIKLFALPGFMPIDAPTLLTLPKINVYSFLLGIIYYLYNSSDNNTVCADTVAYFSKKTTFDSFCKKAMKHFDNMELVYDINECINSISVDRTDSCHNSLQPTSFDYNDFKRYITAIIPLHRRVEFGINKTKVDLDSIYIHPDIYTKPIMNDVIPAQINNLWDLTSNYTLLIGNKCSGKTITLHKLCLDLISRRAIPVYISLLSYLNGNVTIFDLVKQTFQNADHLLSEEKIIVLLQQGQAHLIFDDIDELPSNCLVKFNRELLTLMKTYKRSHYLLACSNYSLISNQGVFECLQLAPFTKEQLLEYILNNPLNGASKKTKIDFYEQLLSSVNATIAKEQTHLFDNLLLIEQKYQLFINNVTFSQKPHSLYEELYLQIANQNISSSANYGLYTGLDPLSFKLYLSEFCALCYLNKDFVFDVDLLLHYFVEITERHTLSIDPFLFIKDLHEKLYFLELSNQHYYISSEMLQYYLIAYYFNSYAKYKDEKIITSYFLEIDNNCSDHILEFLMDMDEKCVEKLVFQPFLKEIFDEDTLEEASSENKEVISIQYRKFLNRFYPYVYASQDCDLNMVLSLQQTSAIFRSIYKANPSLTFTNMGKEINATILSYLNSSNRVTSNAIYDEKELVTFDEDGEFLDQSPIGYYLSYKSSNFLDDLDGISFTKEDYVFLQNKKDFSPFVVYETFKDYYEKLINPPKRIQLFDKEATPNVVQPIKRKFSLV